MSSGAPKADVAVPLPKKAVEAYFQFLKEVSADEPVVQLAFWKVHTRKGNHIRNHILHLAYFQLLTSSF